MRLPLLLADALVVKSPQLFTQRLYVMSMVLFCTALGCARTDYRREADRQSYCLIESRQTDARWDVPERKVEPQYHSRMYMAAEDDCGPKPVDDEAASCYMQHPNCINNTCYYSKIPDKVHSENPIWADYLPRGEDGQINLTQPLAIDLALLHSREYQTAFEAVYQIALGLTGERFEFDCQWFGGLGAGFTATGADRGNGRGLEATLTRLGFRRNLPGGGQFATSILNSLAWDFGGGNFQAGSASLVSTFTQPLLRGAFRHVRLESLTQAERNLLYAVRGFARFRRRFYTDIVSSYLNLLTQVQAIHNLKTNVANLKQNLVEHEFYVQLEMVSQIQRDQVFQEYQSGRSRLLRSEQSLAASMDEFKFQLGLPSWVPLKIDESLLEPFELVDPKLVELQDEAQELYETLVQYLPPDKAPKSVLLEKFDEYESLRSRVSEFLPAIEGELKQWKTRLVGVEGKQLSVDDRLDIQQQEELEQRIRTSFDELRETLEGREEFNQDLKDQLERYDTPAKEETQSKEDSTGDDDVGSDDNRSDAEPEILAWESLMQAVGEILREEIAELYVAQTQVRLFLIDIEPQSIDQYTAVSYAHLNRLDLMNDKARVMDAFRRVEVAADALESDLTVSGSVAVGSDPNKNNAYRLDSSSNTYRVGVEFDGPLNRLNERNDYRAAQIGYQQASRNYVAQKDQIANDVRSLLRRLELARLDFQIARQQLVAATRQVDQAQIDLRRSTESDSNLTLFLLEALGGMLDARNSLIVNWVDYRRRKMLLFDSLEILYLDENGEWINSDTGLDDLRQFNFVDQEYFPPQWVDTLGSVGDMPAIEAGEFDSLQGIAPNDSPEGTDVEEAGDDMGLDAGLDLGTGGPGLEPAIESGSPAN